MLGVDDGITSGNLNTADVLFLISAIVFGLAALISIPKVAAGEAGKWRGFLVAAGLTLVAVAWLLL